MTLTLSLLQATKFLPIIVYRSGGITLIVKNELSPYIRMKKRNSKLILWFSISKHLMLSNEECGIVYIPLMGQDTPTMIGI